MNPTTLTAKMAMSEANNSGSRKAGPGFEDVLEVLMGCLLNVSGEEAM
jgi:hypothetical protein